MSEQHYVYISTTKEKRKYAPVHYLDEVWVTGDRWYKSNNVGSNFDRYNVYRRPVAAPEQIRPWVAFATRQPTRDDADPNGYILMKVRDTNILTSWDYFNSLATHWMPIPPLPAPKELSQEDKDEAAFIYSTKTEQGGYNSPRGIWNAALKYARDGK